jgi:hypothetical protein
VDPDRLLASNEALGMALVATLLVVGHANRVFLRDVARDPEAWWRMVARLALAITGVLVLWVSLLDNWRQLIGEPYRATRRFASERVQIDPPSTEVRTVTILLLAAAIVLLACLLARHVGGYLLQIVLLLGSVVLWAPLFAIRERLNVNLAFGFDGSWTSPLDVLGYALFVVLAWLFEITLILATGAVLLAAAALPITLALDLLRLRRPRDSDEAAAFFGSLSQRAKTSGRPR